MSAFKNCVWRYLINRLPVSIATGFAIVFLLSSCSNAPPVTYTPPLNSPVFKRVATIKSIPSGASITINKTQFGVTPLKHEFHFKANQFYTLGVAKEHYLPTELQIDLQALDNAGGILELNLVPHPFIETTAVKYPANTWFKTPLSPEVLEQNLWDKMITIIKTNFPTINYVNKDAGIIETAFRSKTVSVNGVNEYIHSKMKTKFHKGSEVIMDMYLETEVSSDRITWRKFNRALIQDIELIDTLKSQVGPLYYLKKRNEG